MPLRRYGSIGELRADLYNALIAEDLIFSSSAEEEIVALLNDNSVLSEDQWDQVFMFMEDNEETPNAFDNLFRVLMHSHIDQINTDAPELLSAIGRMFCTYVYEGVFNFAYCDVLADKILRFFDYGATDIKALALLSLLKMGTGHNRWYVERVFINRVGHNMPEEIAQRIIIEARAQGINFGALISRMEGSVQFSRGQLHPILQSIL